MLSLLPLDPRGGRRSGERDACPFEPRLDRGPDGGLAAKPQRERDLVELDAEAAPQIGESSQLIQFADSVQAVPAR